MSASKPQGPSVRTVPPGDDRERLVCPDCGYVEYDNPKIVVGAVCEWQGRVLLCKRSIEPRKGYWTIPAGFLEIGETPTEGMMREVWEEACARVVPKDLLGVFDIPHIGHVYMVYRAPMASGEFAAGAESEEADLFDWDHIPWNELAFPSVDWALKEYRAVADRDEISARLETWRWQGKR